MYLLPNVPQILPEMMKTLPGHGWVELAIQLLWPTQLGLAVQQIQAVCRTFGICCGSLGVSIGSLYFTIFQLTSSQLQVCGLKYACSQMPKSTWPAFCFALIREIIHGCRQMAWASQSSKGHAADLAETTEVSEDSTQPQISMRIEAIRIHHNQINILPGWISLPKVLCQIRRLHFFNTPGSFWSLVESTWSSPKFGHPAT